MRHTDNLRDAGETCTDPGLTPPAINNEDTGDKPRSSNSRNSSDSVKFNQSNVHEIESGKQSITNVNDDNLQESSNESVFDETSERNVTDHELFGVKPTTNDYVEPYTTSNFHLKVLEIQIISLRF